MMSAESINRIFFPALIAIREAAPFGAMYSCGDRSITIATPFPRFEECCASWLGKLLIP
jgi:hypothetical protein